VPVEGPTCGGSILDGSSDNGATLVSPWYFNDPSRSVCKVMVAILEKEERGNEMEGRRFLRVEFAKMLGAWKPTKISRKKFATQIETKMESGKAEHAG